MVAYVVLTPRCSPWRIYRAFVANPLRRPTTAPNIVLYWALPKYIGANG
jgi:hypothetical protein